MGHQTLLLYQKWLMRSWATCSRHPSLSRDIGLDDFQSPLQPQPFCGMSWQLSQVDSNYKERVKLSVFRCITSAFVSFFSGPCFTDLRCCNTGSPTASSGQNWLCLQTEISERDKQKRKVMCLSINAWKYVAISLKREGKFYHQQHFKQLLRRYFSEIIWTGKWRDVAHPSSGAEAKRQVVQKKKTVSDWAGSLHALFFFHR